GRDLDWFWREWVYTTARLDQAVDSVSTAGDTTLVHLSNRGQMALPLTLELKFADGASESREYPIEMWNLGSRFTARVATPRRVVGVVVDPKELPIHDTGFAEARRLARALAAQQSDVLVAETPRDVRLGALASFARRFALVYSYNVNRAVPPRDPVMRLAYRRVRLTIFRTHTGEREVLASAPFMGRPPHRVIHEGV